MAVQDISAIRRISPQILAALAKNLMILNIGEFMSILAIVISSLVGLSDALNPDETVRISAAQSSWLSTFSHLAHPIGGLLSGPINDRIGRRKAIMLVNIPLTIGWIVLGFSQSFPLICMMFTLLGFSFGLKEAPAFTYSSEISEPSVRGVILSMTVISFNVGVFIVMALGSIFSWRQVSLICATVPICCLVAVLFVPESPSWLLSKGRPKDAQKSLQWLRGWVSPQTVHQEFTELQKYSDTSNACVSCAKQSIRCNHSKSTFRDKIKELRRRRNSRPFILMICLSFFTHFSVTVLDPYIIQILIALGTPIDPNLTTVLISSMGIFGCIFLISTVKILGRRKIFLITTSVLAFSAIALSVYSFVFFPSGWISFQKNPNDAPMNPEVIRSIVGNYGYLALILMFIIKFCGRIGLDGVPALLIGEVFPYKLRSFLCGVSLAAKYIFSSIAVKTYYDVEMLLSLPGAILFYGVISLIGCFVMYLIMPETEQRSLEDIELHYSDATKHITDIRIAKSSKTVENQ